MQSNHKERRHPAAQHLSTEALAEEEPQRGRDASPSRRSPNPSPSLILLKLIATAFLVISCQKKPTEPASTTQTHTSAETSLTLSLSSTTLPTSGMLTATLSAEHPQSTHIEFPSTTANFGDFTAFKFNDTPPALNTAGKINTARTYTLEPDLPGTSTFPSLTTIILPDSGTPTEILTDPVPIEITSVLADSKTEISDIYTTQTSLHPFGFSIPFPLFATLLGILAIVAYFIIRHITKPTARPTSQSDDDTLPENLTELPPTSMLAAMEPPIARIISRRHGIAATDFTSLEKSNIPGLAPLVACHRKLSYSDTEPTTAEATALLADFKTFLGKEAP